MSDSLWHDASESLHKVKRDIELKNEGPATIEQRLQITQIEALLAIGQELSSLNPQNTTYFDNGSKKNGWGLPIPD